MTSTPQIEIASSDKQLNQRFRKPKSNWLIILLVVILGIGLAATPMLMSGGKNKEQQGDTASKEEKPSKPALQLIDSSFEADILAGELATIELKDSLRNAMPSTCRVEWDAAQSTLPQAAMKQVKVDDQMTITIPTHGIEDQVAGNPNEGVADWKLVGKIVSTDQGSEDFVINLKVKQRNTAPTVNLPADIFFDPVTGATTTFSVSDSENPADQLTTTILAPAKFDSEIKIVNLSGNQAIQFRPSKVCLDPFSLTLEVEDAEGLATEYSIVFTPKPKLPISTLLKTLEQETNSDFSSVAIKNDDQNVSLNVSIDGHPIQMLNYLGVSPPASDLPKLTEGQLRFSKDGLVVTCSEKGGNLAAVLARELGQPEKWIAPTVVAKKTIANAKLLATADQLLDENKLFNSKSFRDLVYAYVKDFEKQNATILNQKYKDHEGLRTFLDDQKGFKAEFFLAIDPAYDNLASALNVLNDIREKYPDEILPLKNLAIAIAVCWDNPNANYSYMGHQRRTNSNIAGELTSPVDNFKHFVTYQNQMQGRAQWLPWEFLVHVINHQTPESEKHWALENYLALRSMIGKCYKDVPYDHEMLNTGSRVCKLAGKEYSLANLRAYGGVCAMQADFASRVAKSLGVPAEYVGGKSANGENHAWVMWVEVKNVTRSSIGFSLESFGRYRGDNYYVGQLKDPKSGRRITDRQLEMRLHTVGTDAYAKRQADLLMQVFPDLVKSRKMDLKDQLKFLEQTIKLCPWHEVAWNEVANLIANNEIDRRMNRQMNQILNSMFVHFAAFPDFTWEIFDRLVSFVEKDDDRNRYYVKLLNLYVAAQRPDLACEAQLKLTDYLEDQGKTEVAMQGLAVTVKTFPDEGRYIPRLLDRLEKLVGDDPELTNQLIQFHAQFLPLVPQKRGNSPSKYCMSMYERAIQFFNNKGANDLATLYQTKLQELRNLKK